jgi:chromosomal replication initiation ATPase DnaA
MIIEIKIEAFPGVSMIRLLTSIKILTNLAKKFGINISVRKYSGIKKHIDIIEGIVCNEVEKYLEKRVDPLSLKSTSRKEEIVIPRQIMIKYMRKAKYTLAKAGARYDKDHATAINAESSVESRANSDKRFMETIRAIERRANIQIL